MRRFALVVVLLSSVAPAQAQPAGEAYTLRTARGPVASTLYRIDVPEDRRRPGGSRITLAVARLAALTAPGRPPVIYLAGGPGQSGIGAAQIADTFDLLQQIRRTSDVLLLDQRGTGQSTPRLSCPATKALPGDVFESSAAMERAMAPGVRECAATWRSRGVRVEAFNTESSADDVADVASALKLPRISLFGFSYGTHLAAAVVRRHPALIDRVVFAGFEGPDESEKYPDVYDRQVRRISALAAAQPDVAASQPDFEAALRTVLARAAKEPFVANDLRIGRDGLLYLLRRDIGDSNDLPVFPRLIWQLSRGDTTLLSQFVARRFQQLGVGTPLMSLAVDCASGGSVQRRREIARQIPRSIFGSMTNPPAFCNEVGVPMLDDAFRRPVASTVTALFVSGTLDSNTPPEQAESARRGFAASTHLVVRDAGHESTLVPEVAVLVASFLAGEKVADRTIQGPPLRFLSLR